MYVFDPHKVYQYFKENYVLGKKSPKGWFPFNCPFCGKDKKMALNVEWGYVKCWSCGASSNIAQFVEETEQCSYFEAKARINSMEPSSLDFNIVHDIATYQAPANAITLPEGWQSILDGKGNLGDRARAALSKRGFDLEELDYKGFGYCNKHYVNKDMPVQEQQMRDFFGYIVVPFKKDGELVYYLGRDFIGNFLRYKNPPSDWVGIGKADVIYNEEALHLYKTVYVVEGWSDAQAIGRRGTATLGWNMSNTQLDRYLKSSAKRYVFIPDAGEDKASGQTYYQKAVQLATSFLDKGKEIFVVDLNPFKSIGKDVCEIGWPAVHMHYKKNIEALNWNSAMEAITA